MAQVGFGDGIMFGLPYKMWVYGDVNFGIGVRNRGNAGSILYAVIDKEAYRITPRKTFGMFTSPDVALKWACKRYNRFCPEAPYWEFRKVRRYIGFPSDGPIR